MPVEFCTWSKRCVRKAEIKYTIGLIKFFKPNSSRVIIGSGYFTFRKYRTILSNHPDVKELYIIKMSYNTCFIFFFLKN